MRLGIVTIFAMLLPLTDFDVACSEETEEKKIGDVVSAVPSTGFAISEQDARERGRLELLGLRTLDGFKSAPKNFGKLLEGFKSNKAKSLTVKSVVAGMQMKKTAMADPSKWVALGPGNIGGRVRAIAFAPNDPKKILIGSVGGGIWRSRDGGLSWDPANDFLPNLAVTCIVFHPTNPDVVFASTGEGFFNIDALRGSGIFVSIDGGETWVLEKHTLDNRNFHYVNRISVSADGETFFAATNQGIFTHEITDPTDPFGDGEWSNNRLPSPIRTLDLDCHPSDSSIAIAGTDSGQVLRTADGGSTWQSVAFIHDGKRVETCFAKANPDIVYASYAIGEGTLIKSESGGVVNSFRYVNQSGYLERQSWYNNVVWAGDPTDPNLVIVGGVDLHRSVDGGFNFRKISDWFRNKDGSPHADNHVIVASPDYSNSSGQRRVLFGNDGGLFRTDDVRTAGGNDFVQGWKPLNNGLGISQLYGISVGADGKLYAGLQDNGHLCNATPANANSWVEIEGGDGGKTIAHSTDARFSVGEYVGAKVHRSSDGGNSSAYIDGQFQQNGQIFYKNPPYVLGDAQTGHAMFIAPIWNPSDAPSELWVGGHSIWTTSDFTAPLSSTTGPIWVRKRGRIAENVAVSCFGGTGTNDVVVGYTNGVLTRIRNGNVTDVRPSGDERQCNAAEISPHDPNLLWAAFGGFQKGNLFKSTDGGASWSTSGEDQLPEVPIRAIAVHPKMKNWIYVGTELGVFASEDGGDNWSATNEGPANVSINDFKWKGLELFVATHGRGAYSINLDPNSVQGDDTPIDDPPPVEDNPPTDEIPNDSRAKLKDKLQSIVNQLNEIISELSVDDGTSSSEDSSNLIRELDALLGEAPITQDQDSSSDSPELSLSSDTSCCGIAPESFSQISGRVQTNARKAFADEYFRSGDNGKTDETGEEKVLNGDDDRYDVMMTSKVSPEEREFANAVCLLTSKQRIRKTDAGYLLDTEPYTYSTAKLEPVSSERFKNQEIGGFCSGFLVDQKTIVTAGHCLLSDEDKLDDLVFIFGFYAPDEHTPASNELSEDQIYCGKRLVKRVLSEEEGDFAIIELDREVTFLNAAPLELSREDPTPGNKVGAIGCPMGLPVKVAFGNETKIFPYSNEQPIHPREFRVNTDTYKGNSGSPIIMDGRVVGVLVRGNADVVVTSAGAGAKQKFQSRRQPSSTASEIGTRVSLLFPYLEK